MSITLATEENIRDTVDSLGEVIKYLNRIKKDLAADTEMVFVVNSVHENATNGRLLLRDLQEKLKARK